MLGVQAPVSFRLNPDVAIDTHEHLATGHAGTKFGLTAEVAAAQLRRAAADPALEPVGIAFHLGSQIFDAQPIVAAVRQVAALWQAAAADGIAAS